MNRYAGLVERLQGYYVGEGEPKSLTQRDLKKLERRLDCRLPDDYAHFLADYGCYTFDRVKFPIQDEDADETEGRFGVFFGVTPGSGYDLVYNHETFQGRMPSSLRPIADDPGGNIICISVVGDDVGTVYFWYHDEEEMVDEDEEPGYSNVFLIAESFDEFLNSLEPVGGADA